MSGGWTLEEEGEGGGGGKFFDGDASFESVEFLLNQIANVQLFFLSALFAHQIKRYIKIANGTKPGKRSLSHVQTTKA